MCRCFLISAWAHIYLNDGINCVFIILVFISISHFFSIHLFNMSHEYYTVTAFQALYSHLESFHGKSKANMVY